MTEGGVGSSEGMSVQLYLKGLGLSFLDNQPKELIYVTLDDIELRYSAKTITEIDGEQQVTSTKLMSKIGSVQIDNLLNEDMPVVIGPTKFNPTCLKRRSNTDSKLADLSNYYKIVPDSTLETER